jgi:hypothetical protein
MQTNDNGTTTITDDSNLPADGSTDWRANLPEQLRDAPYFKNPEATPEQVRADLDGAAFWQGNSVLKPGPDASEEARQANIQKVMELYPDLMVVPEPDSEDYSALMAKLGKPDDIADYKLPEGVELDPAETEALQQISLKANMTKQQFAEYMAGLGQLRSEAATLAESKRAEDMATLAREWGDAKDQRLGEIKQFLADGPEALQNVEQFDSATLKWLYSKAQAGQENGEISTQQTAQAAMTPVEGMARANEIRETMRTMRNTDPLYKPMLAKLVEAERAAMGGS